MLKFTFCSQLFFKNMLGGGHWYAPSDRRQFQIELVLRESEPPAHAIYLYLMDLFELNLSYTYVDQDPTRQEPVGV
jgi:hypothetical protein